MSRSPSVMRGRGFYKRGSGAAAVEIGGKARGGWVTEGRKPSREEGDLCYSERCYSHEVMGVLSWSRSESDGPEDK